MWRQVLKCRTLSGRSAACVPKHRIVPSGASSSASSCLVPNKSVWMESSGGSKGGRPGSEDLLSTPGFYDNMIQKYASQHNEQFTMKELLEQGKAAWEKPGVVLENAQFLQRELPKRLAKRLLDLQFLPYIVVINPNIKRVYEAYYNAFQTLRQFPTVKDSELNAEFTVLLKRLVDEHGPLVESLAAGLRECKSKPNIGEQLQLDEFLNNMLSSRISRRVLAEQHIALQHKRQNFVGIVCTELNLQEAIEFAYIRAQQICIETYGVSPEIRLSGDKDAVISYIPTHLDYMLFELLKNAMRATVERSILQKGNISEIRNSMPPVSISICRGDSDVTVRICDQGGGIGKEALGKIWNYGYTTVDETLTEMKNSFDLSSPANPQSKMAGLGFGLPLSKLHARYFGGELKLVNVTGYGVDMYLFLNLLDDPESIKIM